MKGWYGIALMFLVACSTPSERAIEHALYEGALPYQAGNYTDAAEFYATASFDPRVAHNLGNTLYRETLLDSAIRAYSTAIECSSNAQVQAHAYHNLGNAWIGIAQRSDTLSRATSERSDGIRIEGDHIQQKVRQVVVRDSLRILHGELEHVIDSALTQGASAYKNALRHDPKAEDTRHNLAFAQKWIASRVKATEEEQKEKDQQNKDKGLSEKAKKLLAQADELVDQYKFPEALKVLQDGLRSDPTLQQRQDYMNKLDVVTRAMKAQ